MVRAGSRAAKTGKQQENSARMMTRPRLFREPSMQAIPTEWQGRLLAIAASGAAEDGAHDLNHLHRVWRNARLLMREHPEANPLVVQAACYLHDLVNLPKNHPDRTNASRMAAQCAREALADAGFPAAYLDGVAHAIEAHGFSAAITPQTIEAGIVQDADRLDALGAVGIARLFYIAGSMHSQLSHPTDPLAFQRPLDDRRFALDHIAVKLATLPDTMRTVAGRRLAKERLQQVFAFRDAFIADWGG
jgi:uncharacterized protein